MPVCLVCCLYTWFEKVSRVSAPHNISQPIPIVVKTLSSDLVDKIVNDYSLLHRRYYKLSLLCCLSSSIRNWQLALWVDYSSLQVNKGQYWVTVNWTVVFCAISCQSVQMNKCEQYLWPKFVTQLYRRARNFREVIFSLYSRIVRIRETLTAKISPDAQ
jgi:hypothetical protein